MTKSEIRALVDDCEPYSEELIDAIHRKMVAGRIEELDNLVFPGKFHVQIALALNRVIDNRIADLRREQEPEA